MVTWGDIAIIGAFAVLAATGVSITALRAGEGWRWALLPLLPGCLFFLPPFAVPTFLQIPVSLLYLLLVLFFGGLLVTSIGMFLFDPPLARRTTETAPVAPAAPRSTITSPESLVRDAEARLRAAYARLADANRRLSNLS